MAWNPSLLEVINLKMFSSAAPASYKEDAGSGGSHRATIDVFHGGAWRCMKRANPQFLNWLVPATTRSDHTWKIVQEHYL